MRLDELGERICVLGPSNSGKSTLAAAIGRRRGLPVVHLDQLAHFPRTDWEPRPEAEFRALHKRAIAEDRWVMDGKYSTTLPSRLERATGIILIEAPRATLVARYLRRCLFETHRVGAIEGGGERIKWSMLRFILRSSPAALRDLLHESALPSVRLASTSELNRFYQDEGLRR